jgi:hypothetical protein
MSAPSDILVIKASGEKEAYRREKIISCLKRTSVPANFHQAAVDYVESRLYPNIKTSEIFSNLKKFLKKTHRGSASRYGLKQALFKLGPSGYPFEAFSGRLLEKLGYQVNLNQTIRGKCVEHEVDVVAQKDKKHFMIECKYHNNQGIKTDVKVALYVWARFEDLVEKWKLHPGHLQEFHQPWLMTNTRCTKAAHQYGRCRRMMIISWDKPPGEGLRELVNQTKLYPITLLSVLPQSIYKRLIEQDIVDLQQFLEADEQTLAEFPPKLITQAKEEARLLI